MRSQPIKPRAGGNPSQRASHPGCDHIIDPIVYRSVLDMRRHRSTLMQTEKHVDRSDCADNHQCKEPPHVDVQDLGHELHNSQSQEDRRSLEKLDLQDPKTSNPSIEIPLHDIITDIRQARRRSSHSLYSPVCKERPVGGENHRSGGCRTGDPWRNCLEFRTDP